MKLIIIAAHDRNLLIGSDGELPWRIPEDMKHFRHKTMGYPVLMGRGVFEELGEKPLPGRKNVVLTSRSYENVPHFDSIGKALEYLKDEPVVYVIGGGKIYREMLPMAHELVITEVHAEFEGDVWFPEYRKEIGKTWIETSRDDRDGFSFVEYKRAQD
jgi:dihydrofolate reductase